MARQRGTWAIAFALGSAAAAIAACGSEEPPRRENMPIVRADREPVWSPEPDEALDVAPKTTTASTGTGEPTADPDAGVAVVEDLDGGKKAAPEKDAGPEKPDIVVAKPDASAPAPTATATAVARVEPPEPEVKVEPAAPGSADAIAQLVDDIFVPKKTFFARFKQQHEQKVSGVKKSSAGVIYSEKPNKLSFRYDPPNKNRIVSDGLKLKVYVADDAQMIEQPVGNSQYPGALSFLMGKGLRPSFTFSFNTAAEKSFPGGYVLNGKPRSPTPHYERVQFYIDKNMLAAKDANAVRRVLILDTQGNKNRFDFEGASQPSSISSAEWAFTPPAGTNVVTNNK